MNHHDLAAVSVGMVGFGAFGAFAAGHLVGRVREVGAFDAVDISSSARSLGVGVISLAEAAARDVVLLAVPVQAMEGVLRAVAPHVRPGSLVLDVASVKLKSMELMLRHLPAHSEVIGTHPLLGPQSGKDGIRGLPIALCEGRSDPETMGRLEAFLAGELGLRVVRTTPEAHDRAMAYVQALTHLLSRAISEMELPETPMATVAYQRLLAMRANLQHDSWELFSAIESENPFASEVRAALREKLDDLERRLASGA